MGRMQKQITIRRSMILVLVFAILFVGVRLVPKDMPHALRCWELSSTLEKMARAKRREAVRYDRCGLIVPCTPSRYCGNACLPHLSAGASQRERAHAADAHKQAAEAFRHGAELDAATARRFRLAAYDASGGRPSLTAEEAEADRTLSSRYQCDTY